MEKICNEYDCTGCGACAKSCPRNCIRMQENEEGFSYPHINTADCINCKKCVLVCPIINQPSKSKATFYMGIHKDKYVLEDSSSGGVFTALADYVLEKNGVVIGAYQNNLELCHILIRSRKDIWKLRKSKYYQSSIICVYEEIKRLILSESYVLFSGTACQVAAVKNYLGKLSESQFLVTVDVLCHGVTSKKIIEMYVSAKEKRFNKKIKTIVFRLKGKDLKKQNDW